MRIRLSLWLVLACCVAAGAEEPAPATTPAHAAAPTETTLPPARFEGNVAASDIYARLLQAPQFRRLSRDAIGSPIELRVYHTFQSSAGGKVGGAVTGILAASTLGILPAVTSGEHVIVYDILVNGTVQSTFSYRKAITRSRSMWSTDTTYGLGSDGLEWAKGTADQFVKDAASDPKLTALLAEYDYYFNDPAH